MAGTFSIRSIPAHRDRGSHKLSFEWNLQVDSKQEHFDHCGGIWSIETLSEGGGSGGVTLCGGHTSDWWAAWMKCYCLYINLLNYSLRENGVKWNKDGEMWTLWEGDEWREATFAFELLPTELQEMLGMWPAVRYQLSGRTWVRAAQEIEMPQLWCWIFKGVVWKASLGLPT